LTAKFVGEVSTAVVVVVVVDDAASDTEVAEVASVVVGTSAIVVVEVGSTDTEVEVSVLVADATVEVKTADEADVPALVGGDAWVDVVAVVVLKPFAAVVVAGDGVEEVVAELKALAEVVVVVDRIGRVVVVLKLLAVVVVVRTGGVVRTVLVAVGDAVTVTVVGFLAVGQYSAHQRVTGV
jgi:hypothetical protein